MLRVLQVLPHVGGGGELHVDLLAGVPGTTHQRLYVSAGRSPATALGGLPGHARAIRRAAAQSDLVHVHGDMAAALTLELRAGRPAVWTTHGLSFLRRSRGAAHALFERRLRAVIARSRATVCTTEAERRELLTLAGSDAATMSVVANGIALPPSPDPGVRARLRSSLGLGDDDVAALFAGRLDDDKGAPEVIAAAGIARDGRAPLTLLVAGEGPLEAELRGAAGPAVRMLGFRDDLQDLLAATDVFVLPSRREGSSYAVIEALAAGLPVVVCDGRGNPETVGDAGVVVPCGDAHALAGALAALAADPCERARLGAAGRDRVAGELGIERFLADIAGVYREAVPGWRA